MKVTPIASPLPGERVLEVEPAPAGQLDPGWHRRLRLTDGRSMTDTAFTAEQEGRAGRLATRGQAVSEGVVSGLEVSFAFAGTLPSSLPTVATDSELGTVQVAAGQGLTATGEDVNVFAPIQVPLTAITVVGAPLPQGTGTFDPTLGQLLRARPGPRTLILALEPVEIEAVGRAFAEGEHSMSPCEQDPSDDPFSDIERVDGCRLVLLAWPDDALGAAPHWSSHNRNLLAHHIFQLEHARGPDEPMPWAVWAVPLAVVGVCPGDGAGLFLDMWATRRLGGRPRPRSAIVPGSGAAALWQARYEQFADQLASDPVDPNEGAWTRFVRLPPLGVLPRELATLEIGPPEDPRTVSIPFFPAGIAVEAAPIPLSQLDFVARRALPLEAIDLAVPGEVKLLVPVAEQWFDPELLIYEQVHPAFFDTLNQAYKRRDTSLAHRTWLRDQLTVVDAALRGPDGVTTWPEPDPEAVDDDELAKAGPFAWTSSAVRSALIALRTNATLIRPLAEAWAGDAVTGGLVFDALAGDPLADVVIVDGPDGLAHVAGRRLDGGWVRADVPTSPDRLQVHLQAASVYIVTGRLTPEIVDRALEFADETPLLIVAQSVQESALLRIDRVREDGLTPPLVVQGFPDGSDQRIPAEDLAIQIGATRRPLGDEWGVKSGVADVVVQQRAAWLAGPILRNNAAFSARASLIQAAITAATTDLERARLQTRLDAFQGQVGVVRLLPVVSSPDGRWKNAWRTLTMLRALYPGLERAQAIPDPVARRAAFIQLTGRLVGGSPPAAPLDVGAAGILVPELDTLRGMLATPTFAVADRDALDTAGIVGLVDRLEDLVREADHTLDMGFLRVQGNTFRVREILLGRDVATRMATSPILAQVAKEIQGNPSAEAITAMLARLKEATPDLEGEPSWLDLARRKYPTSFAYTPIGSLPKRFGEPVARMMAVPGAPTIKVDTVAKEAPASAAVPSYNRGTGITARINESATVEARFGSFQAKASALSSFKGLRLNLGGVEFPNVAGATAHGIGDDEVQEAIDGVHETSAENADEAALLSESIASLETTLTWLRLVEARVKAYKAVIEEARALWSALESTTGVLRANLHAGTATLAEARHDVEVTRALLGEEQARVARLNAWRAEVLATRVPFLVFCRPRVVDAADDLPVHDVAPALLRSPVLDCLSRPASARDELRDAIEMVRDAPARWFPVLADELATIDRIERMEALLAMVRQRAATRATARPANRAHAFPNADLGRAVASILDARETAFVRARAAASAVVVPTAASWKGLHTHAVRVITVGDLIESRDVRAPLSKDAAELIERYFRVTACLCEELTQVGAAIRLDWALRMSQFDRAIDLRDLSDLPRWEQVGDNDRLEGDDPFLRQELQALVDWLYQQIDGSEEARAFVHDLVRVCFLLASHAPVDRVIAGRVTQPSPVRVGGVVPVRVDTANLRIGMTVLVHAGGDLVARGVVEDLANGFASSRILEAHVAGVSLQQGDAVRFVEPAEAEKVSAHLAKGQK